MKNIIIGLLSITILILFLIVSKNNWGNEESRIIISKPVWENKVLLDNSDSVKISLITDTHIVSSKKFLNGEENFYLGEEYAKVFRDFNQSVEKFNPDFIVHLGDIMEGTGESVELGKKNLELVRAEFKKTEKPVYWLAGNHDLRAVPRRYFQEILGIDYANYFFDHGPYRFIILDAGYHGEGAPINPSAGDYVPGFVPQESLFWLEEVLKTSQHSIVLMHYSITSRTETRKGPIKNRKDVLSILEKYNATAVFQGHIEARYFGEVNDLEYYVFPGTKKNISFPGAHYDIVLDKGEIIVTMHYRNTETGEIVSEPFIKEGSMVINLKDYELLKESQKNQEDVLLDEEEYKEE